MGNIPNDRRQLLEFAQAHYSHWEQVFASIGISEEQASNLRTATLQVQAQTLANDTLRSEARTSTQVLSDRYVDLRRAVSSAVRSINTFAENSPKPATVYNAAQIQPPAPRGPSVPPNTPTDLRVALDPVTGALTLRWRASQPRGVNGVVYNIRRRIGDGAGGPDVLVGATGQKRFEDSTVPAGAAVLTYTIQAQRGSLVAPMMAAIQVRFGVGGMGGAGLSTTTLQIPSAKISTAA